MPSELPGELEDAIVAAPHDRDNYAVAGDWLTDRGDPQGELVALQLARLEDNDRVLELQSRLAPIPVGRDAHAALEWRWGFVHGASYSGADPDELERLLAAPVARFVHKLVLVNATPKLVERLGRVRPRCLRTLMIGRGLGSTLEIELDRITPALAPVERLGLRAPVIRGRLDSTALRELSIAELSDPDRLIADSNLPALAKLQLAGRQLRLRPFDDWMSPEYLPALRRLGVGTDRSIAWTTRVQPRIFEQLVLFVQLVATPGLPLQRMFTLDRTTESSDAALLTVIGRGAVRPGAVFPITAGIRIGRAADNQIVLVDPEMREHHAEIHDHNRWRIHCIGDATIQIEGHDAPDAALRDGDELAIGRHVFLVLEHDVAAKAAALRLRYGFG